MTPERIQDLKAQAESICIALCSRPDLLTAINTELSSLLFEIEEEDSLIVNCWDSDERQLFAIWINATSVMVSEVVNGNIRSIQEST